MYLHNYDHSKSSKTRLAIINSKFWDHEKIITVSFIGGTDFVKGKVIQYAKEWEIYANIKFDFITSGTGDIRISFDESSGSWSYIGTDALSISSSKATMNFGWFDDFTSDTEFSRTTIHEFGHALGAIHEHQSPDASIPWDTDAVYEHYLLTQGWNQNQVDTNIFDRYDDSETSNTDYDSASIMHYSIPNSLTIGDYSVGWNTVLSNNDKEFIGVIYPYYTFVTNAIRSSGSTQSDTDYNFADVNGDGKADKIYWNKGHQGGDVRVFLATSGGNFSTSTVNSSGSTQYDTDYNFADVNGDGKADKIYWNKGFAGGDVRVFLATSSGNFSSSAIRSSGSTQSDTDYNFADVNGDGKADKIYWNKGHQGGDVRVFLSNFN